MRELEVSLRTAVKASLPLPSAERPAYVAQCLLAELAGAKQPEAPTQEDLITNLGEHRLRALRLELSALGLLLSNVLNQTRGHPGWPHRAVAEELLCISPTPAGSPLATRPRASKESVNAAEPQGGVPIGAGGAPAADDSSAPSAAPEAAKPTLAAPAPAAAPPVPPAPTAPVASAPAPAAMASAASTSPSAKQSAATVTVQFSLTGSVATVDLLVGGTRVDVAKPATPSAPAASVTESAAPAAAVTKASAPAAAPASEPAAPAADEACTPSLKPDADSELESQWERLRREAMRSKLNTSQQKDAFAPGSVGFDSPMRQTAREVAIQAFAKYDADGSGSIDKSELFAAIVDTGHVLPLNGTEAEKAQFLERSFVKADADGNGVVDVEEFVNFYTATMLAHKAFAKYDTDGSGTIDKDELFAVMLDLGQVCDIPPSPATSLCTCI